MSFIHKPAISTSVLLICLALTLSACVESLKAHGSILARLRNRGPVALSSDNPYLAANLLLAQEMEKSTELKGFIEHRGVPPSIEVRHEFFTPLKMLLYYPAERQTYSLEETEASWFIRGPLTMEAETLKKVTGIASFQRAAAKLPEKALVDGVEPAPTPSILVVATPIAFPSTTFQSPATPEPPAQWPTQAAQAPLTEAELISQLAKGREKQLAEISPKGDIVHYVTFPNETLIAIARWYTLDAGNVGRIARINMLKDGYALSLGAAIVVPSYLIRNKLRLTEEAITRLAR